VVTQGSQKYWILRYRSKRLQHQLHRGFAKTVQPSIFTLKNGFAGVRERVRHFFILTSKLDSQGFAQILNIAVPQQTVPKQTRRIVEKPIYKPSELRSLNKYQCIIKHPDGRHQKLYMPPVGKRGKVPFFYYWDRFWIMAPLRYLLRWK